MATLSDSMVSSSARMLPIRMRPDLSARRQDYLGKSYWVVKEPVGLNYFRFQEEEYTILQMLDGQTSLDEIKERFEAEFPPQKITLEELQQFLGMLHRSGLVIAGVGGQGQQLRKRRDERRRKELLAAASNILCIRFKGIDPERLLNWLYPKVRWLFTPAVPIFCVLLCLSALTLVLVEFDVFQSKLPGFYQFFNFYNALWLAITLGFIKILHEFGHGLSCKHFGGECHEIGIMILVLTPCLYCNVSDSWMLPSKWHRAAIGAAGIFVEVTLASIATFVWWFTEPGLLNNLCLNTMFVASVSTVLFNANPLLRYDGYYVLSDIMEIPNLRQKATTILSRKLGHLCLGLEPPEDPFLPQRNQMLFALYSVAAVVYRWFILASILWFLFQVFRPYRLEIIGQGIILMTLYGLVVMPVYKVGKFFYVPGRIEKVKKPRLYATLGVLAALILAVVFVPLPYSVMCSFEVQARDAEWVYVDVTGGGRLENVRVDPGDRVTEGHVLAELSNIDLELEIKRLEGERRQYEIQLDSLDRQRFDDPTAGAGIGMIEEELKRVKSELADKKAEQARLELRAPVAGIVLPPPSRPRRETAAGQLPDWSGTPLEPENLGCYLDESVPFCQVGDPKQLEAALVIDQTDVDFVNQLLGEGKHPKVEIKFDELPHDVVETQILVSASEEVKAAPERLWAKAGGELATMTDPSTGVERPQSTSYQALAPLGLYGHDSQYRFLRGKLEHVPGEPETEGIWKLRYMSPDGTGDKFAGVAILSDPSGLLAGYRSGDFVAVRRELPAEASGKTAKVGGNPSSNTLNYEVAEIRRLDPANALLRIGLTGQAKVHTKWQPLGTRLWRFVSHTFNFRL